MSESITFKNKQMDGQISERSLLGAVGFALSMASMLTGIYTTILCTVLTSTPTIFAIMRGLALLSIAATYFALFRFTSGRNALVRSRVVKTVFLVFETVLPIILLSEIVFSVVIPIPVVAFAWVLWGVSTGYFTCSWIDGLSNVNEDNVDSINYIAFLAAGVFAICVLSMSPLMGAVAYLVAIALSYFILLDSRKVASAYPSASEDSTSEDSTSEKWLRENVHFKKNGSYILLIDGLLISIIACFLIAKILRFDISPTLMGFSLVGTVLLFSFIRQGRPSLLSLDTSQLLFLPFIASGLMFMAFLEQIPQIVVAILLFVVLFVFEMSNSTTLSERGSLLRISPCYCFAKGRVFIILGQSAGWFVGAFLTASSERFLPVLFTIFVFMLCMYITIAILNPRKYPLAPDETRNIEDPASDDIANEEIKGRPFKDKCAHITLAYNLTPREGEILFFLAKGRNAKYIADKLYVAERTIKTHTYHIYQKMDVHSQQELINIVDEGKIPLD